MPTDSELDELYPSREEKLDRLDRLATRLEQDGAYTDAIICADAYHLITGTDPPLWRAQVDKQWGDKK